MKRASCYPAVSALFLMLSSLGAGISARPSDELPLHTHRSSDRALFAWAGDDMQTVHDAVRAGDLAKVKALVAEDPKVVNEKDDLGQSPLHLAAAAGRQDMVDFLTAKGADEKAVCRDGRSLVHCAATGGLVELMDRLIKSGSPVDAADRYGRTPLLEAAEAGSDRAAEFLLSRGANVMSRDYYQQTPLHEATFSGNLRLLEILVRHGADINALNQEGSTPLLYVSQAGREDVIDWLLEHGAKLDVRNKFNETPLTFPLGNGFLELVEKLWPRAEALNDRDFLERYPLHRMAYLGNDPGTAFLLGKGLPIDLRDESGRTPFQRAAQGGNVDIARRLLARGAKVDAPDPDGSTPLHLAVKKGRTEMVRFLLEKGAVPGARDGKGRMPLDLAGEYGYPSIAEILKDAGAAPTQGQAPQDVASFLVKPLKNGQAIVWTLGHCGFAVKTRSRLLVFDYFSRGGSRPEKPSLANGFVDPEEIKDLEVVVFVSHAHGDHFDPVILDWRSTIKNIRYIFGWNAGKGERAIDMPAPRATETLGGMEIFTVNDEHDDVPEVAYLVRVDGLAIYHSGDYMGPLDGYREDMAYLLKKAGTIDLAFIEKFQQAESLKPRVVFPIHAYNREFMYGAFAREAAEKKLPSRVILPENKGDRHEIYSQTGDITPASAEGGELGHIERSIRGCIGWAKDKDFRLLYSLIANDPDFLEVHPDGAVIKGFEEFKKGERFWGSPDFKAVRYEIRDLKIKLSKSGEVAWFFCILDDINEWKGQPANWENTRWTGVLEKRDGRWVMVQQHFSFAAEEERSP